MITNCDCCYKIIDVTERERRRYKHHFCSRVCYHNYKKAKSWKCRVYTPDKSNLIQNKLSVWAEIKMRCNDMELKDKDMKQLGRLLACSKGKEYKEVMREYMKRKESKR